MERQRHGFDFEQHIIDKYSLVKAADYTSTFDAYAPQTHIPVSIKCIKDGAEICLGDFFRQQNIPPDFYLIVGFYSINGIQEYSLLIDGRKWKALLPSVEKEEVKAFLDSVSNDYCDDTKWKEGLQHYKEVSKRSIIKLRFKRDHKKQKRVQCAIRYKDFFNMILQLFPQREPK